MELVFTLSSWTMKFATAAAVLATANAFTIHPNHHGSASLTTLRMSTTDTPKTPTKKEDRLRFMKSNQFYRKGFKEVRDNVEKTMQEQFKSELVDDLKQNNYVIERDGVKVYLAKVNVLVQFVLCEYLWIHLSPIHTLSRILDSVGVLKGALPWPMKQSNTFRTRGCTLPMNSFTILK